jgi:hypothetical protein
MTIIQISNNQDRFGFYQVGDFRSYSRNEAYELSKGGQKVSWNFNQEVYSSLDWSQEPQESLEELYRQHAQRLREKYDYLVLWFSGGADSSNILNTFLNYDIRIDEVVSYVNYEATGDKFNFLNAEIFNVAVPRADAARVKQPWLKHRLIDLCQITIDSFSSKDDKFDWIYDVNSYQNPNALARRDIKTKVPEWMDMIDRGMRVGFIHGIDKPKVTGLNGKFYYQFVNMVDTAVSPLVQRLNREWEHDELFYWSPDAHLIPIKQCHVIKRFLKSATDATPGVTSERIGLVSFTYQGKILWLTLDTVNQLIYPWWQPTPFQIKTPSTFFTPRDTWFFKLPDSEIAKYSWRVGLDHLWRSTANAYKRDPKNIFHGFFRDMSPPYYLGK